MEYYISGALIGFALTFTFTKIDLAPTLWLAVAIFHGAWSIANAIRKNC